MKGGTESGRRDEGGECGQNESASSLPLPVKASAALGGKTQGGMKGEPHRDVWMGGELSLMEHVQFPPFTSSPTSDFSPRTTLNHRSHRRVVQIRMDSDIKVINISGQQSQAASVKEGTSGGTVCVCVCV